MSKLGKDMAIMPTLEDGAHHRECLKQDKALNPAGLCKTAPHSTLGGPWGWGGGLSVFSPPEVQMTGS